MKNLNIVQVVLIGVSIVAIISAVLIFAVFTGRGGRSTQGTVVLWGTIGEDQFDKALQALETDGNKIEGLKYVEKDPLTIEDDLLKGIAEGSGPDLVLLNEKQVLPNTKRIQEIPFDSYPLRNYQDTFIDEGALLKTETGFLGLPFLIDPIVMYYNKDLLSNAGFAKPPQTWTEVLSLAPVLTQKDSSFNISKSTIALGAFDNILNAKDIFWTLVLQAGNPVIQRKINQETGKPFYQSIFDESLNYTLKPTYAATNFFTQFSNPTKTVYSWNRSIPDSQTSFISGDLVFYLGLASEQEKIKHLNPNFNFEMTMVPQSQSSTRKATYGSMYVLMVPRTSSNVADAVRMMYTLTASEAQTAFAKELHIASVRKDLLAKADTASATQSIINRSAIIAQGVLEPEADAVTIILKEMVDTIVSGQYEISQAITRADEKLTLLLAHE
jgi:ABC-type glycerol-3-phosphate transport system substrate-binding protein